MEESHGGKARAFISIELTEEIREKLSRLSAELDQYGAKPVAKENMHITLFFLGDISDITIDKTKKIMGEAQPRKILRLGKRHRHILV